MASGQPKGSYTCPAVTDDPDRTGVLRNKLNLTAHSELRPAEYALTNIRLVEINQGSGPSGNFDTAHLKAIHRYIFQDVYEWAGHTRNESPVVDGQRVEPVGGLFQGGTSFLPGSRIEMGLNEALRPIADPPALSKATPEQFAERAARSFRNRTTCIHSERATAVLKRLLFPSWAATTGTRSIFPSSPCRA